MSKIRIFFILLLIVGFLETTQIIFINVSSSIPTGLYVRDFGGEVRNGDLVVYKPNKLTMTIGLENGYFQSGKQLFIKKAELVDGGTYSIDANTRDFIVDGIFIGKCFEYDFAGHEMPFAPGIHEIGKDEFLPVGVAERSFDGRYTGAVSKDNIVCKAVPLLLFDIP